MTKVEQLAETIGPEAYQQLLEALGGRRLHVPAQAGPNHYLVATIGQDAANKLCAAFDNDRIDLPLGERKRALILQALARKTPIVTIAKTYYVTERYVYKVQAAANKDQGETRQMKLL